MRFPLVPCALLALSGLAVPPARCADAPPADPRARELIATLGLSPLPGESGYLAVIGHSSLEVSIGGRTLPAHGRVYYLLTQEKPINYLHWLAPDDTHILIEGGPVDYYLFHPDGSVEVKRLGRDAAAGETVLVSNPGNSWKALKLAPGARYALMVNILTPEWTADRCVIGAGKDWMARYQGKAPWATPTLLRELIGPNFKDAAHATVIKLESDGTYNRPTDPSLIR